MNVKFFDGSGAERDVSWLRANYGGVRVEGTSGVVELRECINGSASLVVTWLGAKGQPRPDEVVYFGWPDGRVEGVTGADGTVGFGMGGGAYYPIGGTGPHHVEVGGVRVDGLGMKWGTNHWHLDVIYREGQPEPEPTPEPQPTPSPEPEPDKFRVQAGVEYSARLIGDTLYWQEGRAADAVWWFVGQHVPGLDLWLPESEPLTAALLATWYGELLLRLERYGKAIE